MSITPNMTRREVLLGVGGLATMASLLQACGSSSPGSVSTTVNTTDRVLPTNPTQPCRFLTTDELTTLRAFVDRIIPADTTPGAVEAKCAEAIDALLGAFMCGEPAFIYAGGPFSDRAGNASNDFARFIPLDAYEALAWRITIEGSLGLSEREFNGPVRGLQSIYREGLAQLNARATQQGAANFAALSAAQRDAILNDTSDARVQELLDVGYLDTLDAMYGAPEYGGNFNKVGWSSYGFDGDVHPRGFTDRQVVNADNPAPTDGTLPASFHDPARRTPAQMAKQKPAKKAPQLARLKPARHSQLSMAPPETLSLTMQAADRSLKRLRELVNPTLAATLYSKDASHA